MALEKAIPIVQAMHGGYLKVATGEGGEAGIFNLGIGWRMYSKCTHVASSVLVQYHLRPGGGTIGLWYLMSSCEVTRVGET